MQKNIQKEINWLLKEKYHNKLNKNFYKDIKRLEKGEPVDYVIGFTEFLGCKIDLSKKPLIPRPETEFWVGVAINEIKKEQALRQAQGKILHILDMFAGSGCIGIAVLRHIKNSCVTFSDIDTSSLSLIRANKGNVIKSDIFSNIKNKYDFIFANPPYIPIKKKNKIQKSVLKYEPRKALFGGVDGLFFINKFLREAKKYLNSGGVIFMEFDGSTGSPQAPSQKNNIEKLLKKCKYNSWKFNKDQYGKWRRAMIK